MDPYRDDVQYSATPQAEPISTERNGVLIPVLISGIFNILTAAGWAFTICGIPLAVALTILAVYEFITFANGQTMPREDLGPRAGVLGVLEICTIITGNLGSFICGIIVLVNRGKV